MRFESDRLPVVLQCCMTTFTDENERPPFLLIREVFYPRIRHARNRVSMCMRGESHHISPRTANGRPLGRKQRAVRDAVRLLLWTDHYLLRMLIERRQYARESRRSA